MSRFRLSFQVPETHLEEVKAAVFAAGAGTTGEGYDQCCFQVRGEGQFRPLAGSNPRVGETGKLERLTEYRVETICADRRTLEAAVAALRSAHPWEQPAFEAWPLEAL